VSWEAVTAVGTVFTWLVIVVSALVGIGQLRQFRAQRQDAPAVELVRSIQDHAFLQAYLKVFSAPAQAGATDGHGGGSKEREAEVVLGFRFEMLGVLVYRRVIHLRSPKISSADWFLARGIG
jgi:hypothetical protein